MRNKRGKLSGLFCIRVAAVFLLNVQQLYAQNTSFLGDGVDDYVRRSQLLGKLSVQQALTSRSFSSNYAMLDTMLREWPASVAFKTGKTVKLNLLPLTLVTQYNSHHGYGGNDAGMIPARGMQTALSAGIKISAGGFSLQVKPEFIYASNPWFETYSTEQYDPYWVQYYRWLNSSDIPERFDNGSYNKFYPGQSSIRYTTGAISLGVSTENIWWGPGMRNTLVMGNNAPGFLHGTLNTVHPIKTGIGSFEGQIIGGTLSGSGILPPDRNRYNSLNQPLYRPKPEESRYVAGMVLSWQPKWIKGLFVGFAKASYLYNSSVSGLADILPLEGIIKSSSEKNQQKAALGSLFARYVMPEEKAELYFEFGRNDKSPNLINLVADQGYPAAYVAGFRKLFPIKGGANIEVASEFTQLQLPTADLVFSARSWYTDSFVRHGYTNQGQVLGASIGPGSNSQMLDISWVKGFNKIGLMFERLVHNNDFFYNAYSNPVDYTRHWIELSTTAHVDWRLQRFLLSSQIALVRSLNYEYYTFPDQPYFSNGYDVLNFYARISLSYRL
jgi:hypothetical protein